MRRFLSGGCAASILFVSPAANATLIVGHPVPLKFAITTGLVIDAGEITVSDMHVNRCNGTWSHYELDETFDIVAHDTLTLPNGNICGVDLDIVNDIVVTGYGTNGGTFELTLDVSVIHVVVNPQLTVTNQQSDADWVRLAGANWVTATLLGLDPNEHIVIGPTSGLHDDLADALTDESTVLR